MENRRRRRSGAVLGSLLGGVVAFWWLAIPPEARLAGDWKVRWDRSTTGWSPDLFTGTLHIERRGGEWGGSLKFDQSGAALRVTRVRVDGDHAEVGIVAQPKGKLDLALWLREGRFVGELRWGDEIGWSPISGVRPRAAKLVDGAAGHSLPHGEPAVDRAALARLRETAEGNSTSGLVIVQDGKIVAEWYRSDYEQIPLVAMSASKSVLAIGVGMLVHDGKLTLQTKLSDLLPETKGTPKARITVRQLMNHTSGLHPDRYEMDSGTIRRHALASPLVFEPGSCFQYNNNAVDLLAVVAQAACGRSLADYMDERLFRKLDCVGASWMKDSDGVPRGAGEVMLRPVDMAKLGQLVLDDGVWRGERLLPRGWMEQSAAAGQPYNENCGLLWWREGSFAATLNACSLASWKKLGAADALLAKARPLVGRKFETGEKLREALKQALGSAGWEKLEEVRAKQNHAPLAHQVASGPVRGYSARGWLGQYIVVLPGAKLVGVRMRGGKDADDQEDELAGYDAFGEDLAKVVGK